MEALQKNYGVEVHWHAYELRPAGSPPMDPAYMEYIEKTSRPRFNAMMEEQHGITPNPGPFGIVTRLPLIGEKVAQALYGESVAYAYHDAVTRAYWQDAQDISDETVLKAIAEKVGMDAGTFAAELRNPRYEREVMIDITQAMQMGLQGVPALIFERKYYVSGAQPYGMLAEIVEQLESSGGTLPEEG